MHFLLSHPEDWPCWTVFLDRSLEYEVLVAILKTDWLILFIKIKTLPKKGLKSFKLKGISQKPLGGDFGILTVQKKCAILLPVR